jgi:hypothetical protein
MDDQHPFLRHGLSDGSSERRQDIGTGQENASTVDFSETTGSVEESAEDLVHIAFSETTEVQGFDSLDHLDTSLAELKQELDVISKQIVDAQEHHERRYDSIEETLRRFSEVLDRLDRRLELAERERKSGSAVKDAER